MADPARRSAAGPASPGADLRRAAEAVMRAAERCAELSAAELRRLDARLRGLVVDEAVIEAEAGRRAAEVLAAAGLVPPPRTPHLHVVR